MPLIQGRIDDRLGRHRAAEEVLYLRSGQQVRRLVPGLENLMADVYWLRTVQYFGGQIGHNTRFELLEPLVSITITLDPRFEIAYRYGATFLSEPPPIGAGDADAGIRVLEAGVRNNPRSWITRQNLAFFRYFFKGDAEAAARELLEAAKLPGAPNWYEHVAADFLGSAGSRETARKIWHRIEAQSEEGPLKRNAQKHLQYLDAEDVIDQLQALAVEHERRHGHKPATLEGLVAAGLVARVPGDPTGVPFAYDPVTGKVEIARGSVLWRQPMMPLKRKEGRT